MGRTSPHVPHPIGRLKDNQILDISAKPKQNSSSSINNQKTDITLKKRTIGKTQANKTENKFLKTLRNFNQREIMSI